MLWQDAKKSLIETFGDHRRSAPPVPIPNTAVKPSAADGSETQCLVRVGYCQIMARFSERRAGPLLFMEFTRFCVRFPNDGMMLENRNGKLIVSFDP